MLGLIFFLNLIPQPQAHLMRDSMRINFNSVYMNKTLDGEYNFLISIQNFSTKPLELVEQPIFTADEADHQFANILYQIEYITNTDTIEVSNIIRSSIPFSSTEKKYIEIKKRKVKIFYYTLFCHHFPHKGEYRVRFVLKSNSIKNAELGPVYTQWLYFQT